MVEIDLNLLGVIFGMYHEFAVRAWRNRGSGMETDRRRHDEAMVVIGVFADQIDSSRCLVNARRVLRKLDKSLLQSGDAMFDGWIRVRHEGLRQAQILN